MKLTIYPSELHGRVRIPGSKSHTVRAVMLAALTEGESLVRAPLASADTAAAVRAAEALGATVEREADLWRVRGVGPVPQLRTENVDVANSGTTLYFALAAAALAREGGVTFDGDASLRQRSALNLIEALAQLGARIEHRDGCCPITVCGILKGGRVEIECPTSQYLSALLVAAPLCCKETVIEVPVLYERPYVAMTLKWLRALGVRYDHKADFSWFHLPGGQVYAPFDKTVPADFSSATFFLCAAALTDSRVVLEGLDMHDEQGDKEVVEILQEMGADIRPETDGIHVRGGRPLRGIEIDLNAIPDALPALAVVGACARGRTVLKNVPQARLKETDRIAVMARTLSALGVEITEREDGLVVDGREPKTKAGLDSGSVHGYDDHRVVMALAVAGLAAEGPVTVDTAEAVGVTFPDFVGLMRSLGARMETAE